jgi:hypothetical protein
VEIEGIAFSVDELPAIHQQRGDPRWIPGINAPGQFQEGHPIMPGENRGDVDVIHAAGS